MNANPYNTTDYEFFLPLAGYKNKPNSNPNKPNLRKAKMNVNSIITKDYRKKDDFEVRINKPNSNPIQTQTKPILKRMNVNFCAKGYYKSKPKAVRKPPLVEVNSEPLRKDW